MSNRVNWKKLVKRIPSRVQIKPKIWYNIVWSKDLMDTKGNELYGLTDFTNRVITIRMDLPPRLTVETFLHECVHMASFEYDLNLTETQVLAMEHSLPYFLKKGNIFNE